MEPQNPNPNMRRRLDSGELAGADPAGYAPRSRPAANDGLPVEDDADAGDAHRRRPAARGSRRRAARPPGSRPATAPPGTTPPPGAEPPIRRQHAVLALYPAAPGAADKRHAAQPAGHHRSN